MDEGTSGAGKAQVNWASAGDFWAMGGYAWYVWGSYGVTFACLAAEVFLLRKRARETKA